MAEAKVTTKNKEDKKLKTSTSDSKDNFVAEGIDLKQLLEAGAHFGHKVSRWHPKMAPFIHSKRGDSHIIDLTQTAAKLKEALDFLSSVSSAGKQVLFVATKRQAKDIVKKAAQEAGMPYVTERWLGGFLTNQKTIGGRVKYLKDLEAQMASGALAAKYSKLEVQRYQEEIDSMNFMYGGVKELNGTPGALFIVDINTEANAVREAQKLNIPIAAIVDSNADPSLVTHPIPCNDDAIKSIQLVSDYVVQAIKQGKAKVKKPENSK